jgi:hypothetical protein
LDNKLVRELQGRIELFELDELYPGGSHVSLSSRSSMGNNLLHTSWWPGTKCSSHLKHRPFARQSTISAGENLMLIGARLEESWLTEPIEVAAGAESVHALEVVRVEVLVASAMAPGAASLCSYARANMTTTSRERDCLRVMSTWSGLPRPVVKS